MVGEQFFQRFGCGQHAPQYAAKPLNKKKRFSDSELPPEKRFWRAPLK
jgi:hypothetical protein